MPKVFGAVFVLRLQLQVHNEKTDYRQAATPNRNGNL